MKQRRLAFSGLIALVVGGMLLTKAPATLWDSAVRHVSNNALALAQAQGSIWHGDAQLAMREASTGRLRPLTPIGWSWQPALLLQGQAAWNFSLAASQPFTLRAGLRTWSVSNLAVDLPAKFALERVPNVFGRAGWHGDMSLSLPRWQCAYRSTCEGIASLTWLGAAVDIFPGRELGDYQLTARANGGPIDLSLITLAGQLRLQAQGQWLPPERFVLKGNVAGDPAFVSRLPNIAGDWVQPTANPGSFNFQIALP